MPSCEGIVQRYHSQPQARDVCRKRGTKSCSSPAPQPAKSEVRTDPARRRAARRDAERMICGTLREDLLVETSKLARKGRFHYLLVESTGVSEPLPVAERRLGRRTILTFPLLPPPQKN